MTVLETFFPLYTAVILCWPAEQGFRFFIPVIPLLLFYSFRGLEEVRGAPARTIFAVLMAAVLGQTPAQRFRLGYLAGVAHFLVSLGWLLFIPFPAGAVAGSMEVKPESSVALT